MKYGNVLLVIVLFLFGGGYFIQFLLDFVLGITTIMFILTLLPGGKGGVTAIKNMMWKKAKGYIMLLNIFSSVFKARQTFVKIQHSIFII